MPKPHPLSKSKIMSGLQCEKRLWYETHLPDQEETVSDDSVFLSAGYEVQEVARSLVPDGVLVAHTDREIEELRDEKSQSLPIQVINSDSMRLRFLTTSLYLVTIPSNSGHKF